MFTFTYVKKGGRSAMMEENKAFDDYWLLPDGYEVQLMVLRDYPGGRQQRGAKRTVFRSRIWIGHQSESEPMLHRGQEHTDLQIAMDACHSMLLDGAPKVIDSPLALAEIRQRVDLRFQGVRTHG